MLLEVLCKTHVVERNSVSHSPLSLPFMYQNVTSICLCSPKAPRASLQLLHFHARTEISLRRHCQNIGPCKPTLNPSRWALADPTLAHAAFLSRRLQIRSDRTRCIPDVVVGVQLQKRPPMAEFGARMQALYGAEFGRLDIREFVF
jgi:hypothetical protein